MKKIVILWMLAAALLCLGLVPAMAEAGYPAIWRLVQRGDQGEQTLGLATAVSDTLLVTADACVCDGSQLVLRGEDGSELRALSVQTDIGGTGLSTIVVDGAVSPAGLSSLEPTTAVSIMKDGSLKIAAVTDALVSELTTGESALALTVGEDVLPGTVLLDEKGRLSGLCVASLGEGKGRALALDAVSVYELLKDRAVEEPAEPESASAPLQIAGSELRVSWVDGLLQVDISAIAAEGKDYVVDVADLGCPYFMAYRVTAGTTVTSALAAPGRTLFIYAHESGTDDTFDESMPYTLYTVPEAEMMTDHSYQASMTYLTMLPSSDTYDETEVLPAHAPTVAGLTSGEQTLWLMAGSVYEVGEEDEECVMTCSLFTPDGWCFNAVSGFVFSRQYMPEDTWHWDVTELMTEYLTYHDGTPADGTYTLCYYLSGKLAGTATFTLGELSKAVK